MSKLYQIEILPSDLNMFLLQCNGVDELKLDDSGFQKKSQCDKDGVHSDVMLNKESLTNAGCTPTGISEAG